MKRDVILVKLMQGVVESILINDFVNTPNVLFEVGSQAQIMKDLSMYDGSLTAKNKKYPFIAMVLPVRERRSSGYYAEVTIERIVIATLNTNHNQNVLRRYQDGGTFKSVLYPVYYGFLKMLAQSKGIVGSDPDNFRHTKMDNPGSQQLNAGSKDFIDSIEIQNLELILYQFKTC